MIKTHVKARDTAQWYSDYPACPWFNFLSCKTTNTAHMNTDAEIIRDQNCGLRPADSTALA